MGESVEVASAVVASSGFDISGVVDSKRWIPVVLLCSTLMGARGR